MLNVTQAHVLGRDDRPFLVLKRHIVLLAAICGLTVTTGCYVPLHSPAILASSLSDAYRTPMRSNSGTLNLATLSLPTGTDYLLGPNDTLEVVVAGLSSTETGEQLRPIQVRVMASGNVRLPLVGEVYVGGMNLSQAQQAIDDAYSDGILVNPKTSVTLAQAATFNVPVMGEVVAPGVYALQRNENDVAHAVASAGGLTQFSAEVIEIHRRLPEEDLVQRLSVTQDASEQLPAISPAAPVEGEAAVEVNPYDEPKIVIQIPLRCGPPSLIVDGQLLPQEELRVEDITIRPGDVVVVPRQPDEVFFVVGELNENNVVNFRVSELDRRLGNAFLLPKDRDIDVVTAVAMAGYIDPINSPDTVTVHRSIPGAPPMLIRVDLIAARYNWRENIYVQPGDIIYLNPDACWWSRRTFDRILPDLLTIPYGEAMFRWINPRARFR
jgi:protein involved in polysaccharide export with SLBB domain